MKMRMVAILDSGRTLSAQYTSAMPSEDFADFITQLASQGAWPGRVLCITIFPEVTLDEEDGRGY